MLAPSSSVCRHLHRTFIYCCSQVQRWYQCHLFQYPSLTFWRSWLLEPSLRELIFHPSRTSQLTDALNLFSLVLILIISTRHSVSLHRLLECTECCRSPKWTSGSGSIRKQQQSDFREPEPGAGPDQTRQALLYQPALPAAGGLQGWFRGLLEVFCSTDYLEGDTKSNTLSS